MTRIIRLPMGSSFSVYGSCNIIMNNTFGLCQINQPNDFYMVNRKNSSDWLVFVDDNKRKVTVYFEALYREYQRAKNEDARATLYDAALVAIVDLYDGGSVTLRNPDRKTLDFKVVNHKLYTVIDEIEDVPEDQLYDSASA